jgi:uncharacterized protein (DUF2062 family)
MSNFKKFGVQDLNTKEMENTNGGNYWGPFFLGYVIGEVFEGIQRGISSDCSEVECY